MKELLETRAKTPITISHPKQLQTSLKIVFTVCFSQDEIGAYQTKAQKQRLTMDEECYLLVIWSYSSLLPHHCQTTANVRTKKRGQSVSSQKAFLN